LKDVIFTQSSVLTEDMIDDLKYFKDTVGSHEASVVNSKQKGVYKDQRKAKVKEISHTQFPDICDALLDLVVIHNPELFKEKHYVNEFNYLMYETGGHFIKHRDWIGRDGDIYNNRIFSTITLINRSDDLEGGNLLIWDREDGNVTQIELDIGETVIFNSRRFHQVTPIIRGTREVLVAWIYLKK